jgi:hypothetical protein
MLAVVAKQACNCVIEASFNLLLINAKPDLRMHRRRF